MSKPMFTGIISNLGEVKEKIDSKLVIKVGKSLVSKLSKGDSISVNGICLTVINLGKEDFGVDFVGETVKKTNIGNLKKGGLVNLELPATLKTFLSGHIVQGHIDGVGKLNSIKKAGNSRILKITVSGKVSQFLVEKGSICVNGVSLTVVSAKKSYFTVSIIPYTWDNTMFNTLTPGSLVNIEADILAKYVKKFKHEKK
ncbi:MAG: riboflavin synthase [Patescibacteria group bacterium]|nr:riboflavin synthase [Patescibacteria group bacterium]